MSEAKISPQGAPLELGITFSERAGQPAVSYKPSAELSPPADYSDRIEWVRQSYERFIEKVLEIETIRGASLAF